MKRAPQTQREWRAAALSCLNFALKKAARVSSLQYDRALAPAHLRATQFSVLITLAGWPGARVAELAAALVLDRTTLSKNLRVLERNGWLRSVPTADKRERALELSPRGMRVLLQAVPAWQSAQQRMARVVDRRLQRALDQVARTAAADSD